MKPREITLIYDEHGQHVGMGGVVQFFNRGEPNSTITLREVLPTEAYAQRAIGDLLAIKQKTIEELSRKNDILVKALQRCCERESDGFGEYVAEEFETNAVIEGRKALAEVSEK